MERIIPSTDCAEKTLDVEHLGFRVTSCDPHPEPPGFCVLRFEESPMQGPLLLRAWLEAGAASGIDPTTLGDTLHLACVALALPVPPALRG